MTAGNRAFGKATRLAGGVALAVVLMGCGQGSAAPSASSAAAKPSGSANASAAATSGSAAASPKATYKFRIPYTAQSGVYTPLWVAADDGIFQKHGIDATVSAMDNNATSAALSSGEIDVSPSPSVLNLIASGGDAVIVASFVTAPIYSVYATSDIASLNDLKGKVIGDTPAGSSPDTVLRALLAQHGLAPDKDVQYLFSPSPATIFSAMQAHRAAAGILSAPVTVQARQEGFKELINTAKDNVPGLQILVAVRKSYLKDNREAVTELLRALIDATAFVKANPVPSKAAIAKYTKTDDKEAIDAAYDEFEPYLKMGPVKPADVVATLQYSPNAKTAGADPASFVDNSIIDSLLK
jgi:NitT/TauT family transport system substrate-binding protein